MFAMIVYLLLSLSLGKVLYKYCHSATCADDQVLCCCVCDVGQVAVCSLSRRWTVM